MTYVQLNDGSVWICWSNNIDEETMDVYPIVLEFEKYEDYSLFMRLVKYSDVKVTDTNLAVACVGSQLKYEEHYARLADSTDNYALAMLATLKQTKE